MRATRALLVARLSEIPAAIFPIVVPLVGQMMYASYFADPEAGFAAAKPASGSAKYDAYIICPTSGTTIGKIAAGISDNLATRSALVALKERRKLILVPRETPFATAHLEAMTKMSTWGVIILPASPGFYHKPNTIEELIDFVVARILDQLDIDHKLSKRWSGEEVK